ncbi:unnamed protein product, partial [marine sediment metagenome]
NELKEFSEGLKQQKVNPMLLKKRLARELITQLYDQKAAAEAEGHFEKTVQQKEMPDEILECRLSFKELCSQPGGDVDISRLLVAAGLAKSRSEANRLIKQGAVSIDGDKTSTSIATIKSGCIIKVGKRRFVKVINKD